MRTQIDSTPCIFKTKKNEQIEEAEWTLWKFSRSKPTFLINIKENIHIQGRNTQKLEWIIKWIYWDYDQKEYFI